MILKKEGVKANLKKNYITLPLIEGTGGAAPPPGHSRPHYPRPRHYHYHHGLQWLSWQAHEGEPATCRQTPLWHCPCKVLSGGLSTQGPASPPS